MKPSKMLYCSSAKPVNYLQNIHPEKSVPF